MEETEGMEDIMMKLECLKKTLDSSDSYWQLEWQLELQGEESEELGIFYPVTVPVL